MKLSEREKITQSALKEATDTRSSIHWSKFPKYTYILMFTFDAQ